MTALVTNGTATYNLDDDTLRWCPEARLDANEYALAKGLGFKWWGGSKAFVAKWTPAREDHLLARVEYITHEVETDDPASRSLRFAQRAAAAAGRADARVTAAFQGLPPGGEPIKIGHHSEGRHRRAIARSDQNMRKAVEESSKAQYWKDRAAGTERRAAQRSNPDVVRRRIAKLEAELRQQQRTLAREGLSAASREWAERWQEHLELRIAFEQGRLAALAPAPFAEVTSYRKSDVVRHKRWGKCEVLSVGKVNLKLAQLEGPTKGWVWFSPPYEVQPWVETPEPTP
ncbi:DUF3560 domain-containing protein [Deinococcus multiflagellatus]|uniref:DUF3560 domain-containing protein n=1 Tax=Deinococcus multiflagellatus TaxID=1656887 RepID=A0ABW1ZIY0_9DEIO|nr:DUF3560 domain-containing protein [Deinococcus multiflagellatus]MBZ9713728.1 DUF3560 domain-containing protein [Deinococcus multiflagellatus]